MSSYFDDADTALRACFEAEDSGSKVEGGEVRWTEFWKRYRVWENKLIEDCLGATRAKKFPFDLSHKIYFAIERGRVFPTSKATTFNERNMAALLNMHTSFLSSRLHSLFHEVATYGSKHNIRHLNDNPAWIRKRAPKAPV